ncbi:DUF1214 domain-containing protein [Reyranella sp.]|uniref:DUF1214 domain-containing protein n=1 Tax=Reyranella sp. TaxID=1929291 RepID=UPI003BAD9407
MTVSNGPVPGLGLTEQDVVDAYIYVLARYLVIRQERIDLAEGKNDYNVIKYNELGEAAFVNPNLDVAYLEAWLAVDEDTPVILEIPRIEGRYYTVQIMDEWADIVCNVNQRSFPHRPHGRFAFCLKGSTPRLPANVLQLDLPSRKAKMLARIERRGDDETAVRLQRGFRIVEAGRPRIEPAVAIPAFDNANPITVDAFATPMVEAVLDSAPDAMKLAGAMQGNVMSIASFVAGSEANRALVEAITRTIALPALIKFIRSYGDRRGGWIATTGKEKGFGEDYWFRTAANFAGIWWNNNEEVVYYIGEQDETGAQLNGDNVYTIHFEQRDLPGEHVDAYWSLTLLSLPDYRVIPNPLHRYSFNHLSRFEHGDSGSLTLYFAASRPAGIPESNWLPTRRGEAFSLNMRMYVPKAEVLNGNYYVPPIVKQTECDGMRGSPGG